MTKTALYIEPERRYDQHMTNDEMKRTWLIQRLREPRQTSTGPLSGDNPFAFGGGFRNGGLSSEAMDLLRPIFSFDYMGAAEFEFGAVPKAFSRILDRAKANDLSAWYFHIGLSEVKPHWEDRDKEVSPDDYATVYVLSPPLWADEIEKRVKGYAADPYGNADRANQLKELTFLDRVLRPHGEPDSDEYRWDTETRGWLELDNGYMFFVDVDMWTQTCSLFGLDTTEQLEDVNK